MSRDLCPMTSNLSHFWRSDDSTETALSRATISPAMSPLVPPIWSGTPVKGGNLFTLTKDATAHGHQAICEVWSHFVGWELRLLVCGELQRSRVCRSAADLLDTMELWQAALLASGWS